MLYLWMTGAAARDFRAVSYSSENKSGGSPKGYIMVCVSRKSVGAHLLLKCVGSLPTRNEFCNKEFMI